MVKNKPTYPIKVLDKSLFILETLLQHSSSISIMEISKKLKIYPSTIHRILNTLKYRGYVEQNPVNQKYQLGLKLVELGMARYHQIDLVKEAHPFLKELVDLCNETVHLGILDQEEVLYIAKEDCPRTIRMVSQVGRRAPLHSTALGKILLAYLPEKEREEIIAHKNFSCFTEHTITEKKELEKELEQVKKQGFALDREENEKDVYCIAAPIKNYQEEVIAAISISSPVYRIDINKKNHLKEALIEISKKISKRLGNKEKTQKEEKKEVKVIEKFSKV